MTNNRDPKITIHLPVYNGEKYLETEIDSLLQQTYTDFELLITDNCSTDRTDEICRRFAAKDSRIRYHVNAENIGANANFCLGIELARGEYFKWAAHDDFHDPTFLQACVEVLDADPDVVLVQSLVQIVDKNGDAMSLYNSNLNGSDSDDPVKRFKPLTYIRHVCTEMFGLYRIEALAKTKLLYSSYHACDRAMLAEIALLGKIVQIKEVLFFNREHEDRYVRRIKPKERSSYHFHSKTNKKSVSQLMLFRDYQDAIKSHLSDPIDRKRARKLLYYWWFVEWNGVRLLIELISQKFPRVYDSAKWVSDRLLKPQHPTIITQSQSK